MSVTGPQRRPPRRRAAAPTARPVIELLIAMVAVMWLVELFNSSTTTRLTATGSGPNVDRLWGIFTAPFLHASWSHLIGNTIPFVFLGLIIAVEGVRRLAAVTAIVIVRRRPGHVAVSSVGHAGGRRQRRRVRLRHLPAGARLLQPQLARTAGRGSGRARCSGPRCCRAWCRTGTCPGRDTCPAGSPG